MIVYIRLEVHDESWLGEEEPTHPRPPQKKKKDSVKNGKGHRRLTKLRGERNEPGRAIRLRKAPGTRRLSTPLLPFVKMMIITLLATPTILRRMRFRDRLSRRCGWLTTLSVRLRESEFLWT